MAKATNEDKLPDAREYPYFWSDESKLTLEEFLKKARIVVISPMKPSMVQDDGTKPWIWVKGSEPLREDVDVDSAIEEATDLLKEVTEKVEQIKNDPSIPARSNKKTGAKSKKEVREQIQAEATDKLREISVRHGYISGKWLIFAQPDKVDMVWSKLASSLVSGPLSSTCAYLAKVSTSPQNDTPSYQHIMCLYMPDVYDKDAITEVMKILLRNHGLNLTGVKSNLYTSIGLDSKHASGIPSTVWKPSILLKDTEIKDLKDAFFAELNTSKSPTAPAENSKSRDFSDVKIKSKPKLKKRAVNDDPFASEDEGDGNNVIVAVDRDDSPKSKSRGTAQKVARPLGSDLNVSDSDDSKKGKSRGNAEKGVPVKKARNKAGKRAKNEDSGDSQDDRPKKKVNG